MAKKGSTKAASGKGRRTGGLADSLPPVEGAPEPSLAPDAPVADLVRLVLARLGLEEAFDASGAPPRWEAEAQLAPGIGMQATARFVGPTLLGFELACVHAPPVESWSSVVAPAMQSLLADCGCKPRDPGLELAALDAGGTGLFTGPGGESVRVYRAHARLQVSASITPAAPG